MASPAQVFFSYFVLHRSKIPSLLTTKVTHLRSLLFREQDGVNSVVRTYYLEITAKLVPTSVANWYIHNRIPNFKIFADFSKCFVVHIFYLV